MSKPAVFIPIANLDFEVLKKDEVIAHVVTKQTASGISITCEQYTDDFLDRPFIDSSKITLVDIAEFLESRCMPESRGDSKELLTKLGLSDYIPLEIVKLNHGLQYEDFIWIRFKGENLKYDDVKIR